MLNSRLFCLKFLQHREVRGHLNPLYVCLKFFKKEESNRNVSAITFNFWNAQAKFLCRFEAGK